MKLGILTLSIISGKSISSYNLQEVGMAKSLAPYFDEIVLMRPTNGPTQRIDAEQDNVKVIFFHSAHLGGNGVFNLSVLDPSIDALICFSDLQLMFGKVFYWAKRNNIRLYAYIGTMSSNSPSFLVRSIMNFVSGCNKRRYKEIVCFAKNTVVKQELDSICLKQAVLLPPGVTIHEPSEYPEARVVREELGIKGDDRIILFVGRLEKEKSAFEMVELFDELTEANPGFTLLMVGTGSLESHICDYIKKRKLDEKVTMIPYLDNKDMWKAYYICHCLVNLAKTEIHGMSILEAMYFGRMVVAQRAPGPCTIIEDGVSGYIADGRDEMIDKIIKGDISAEKARERVNEYFNWDRNAKIIYDIVAGD